IPPFPVSLQRSAQAVNKMSVRRIMILKFIFPPCKTKSKRNHLFPRGLDLTAAFYKRRSSNDQHKDLRHYRLYHRVCTYSCALLVRFCHRRDRAMAAYVAGGHYYPDEPVYKLRG